MEQKDANLEEYLEPAQTLVKHLEAGNRDEAQEILEELTRLRDSHLFQELGKLTREFHDAMNSFRLDSRLAGIAQHDFPDAKERLSYVITLTEQAANTTLKAVEESIPLSEEMGRDAKNFNKEWRRFRGRQMSLEEFRHLSGGMENFLSMISTNAGSIHGKLSEMLMAQSYQDLTGQIIRRVIQLVQDVEDGLVEMIRLSGFSAKLPDPGEEAPGELQGPAVPGLTDADTMSSQDEVDDLLSSLGF